MTPFALVGGYQYFRIVHSLHHKLIIMAARCEILTVFTHSDTGVVVWNSTRGMVDACVNLFCA
jgi:hypothetical protein